MPWPWRALGRWLLVLAGLLAAAATGAQPLARSGLVTLSDGGGSLSAESLAPAWFDAQGLASLDTVQRDPARFQPAADARVWPLDSASALWLRLRLVRSEGDQQQWLLVFPNPLLDRVQVWQRDGAGLWSVQEAGDTLPVDRWAERGRYPTFRLNLPAGQPREVYVRLHSAIPTSVPVRLSSDAGHAQQVQLEYLGLGLAFGALLLMIMACLAQSLAYRDPIYGSYAAYASLSTACVLAYTGVAAHLLWPWSGAWADAAPGFLAALAAGAATLFIRQLTGLPARHARLDVLMVAGGWAGGPLALAYLALPRALALQSLCVYMLAVGLLSLWAAFLAWRRRDVVGLWVLIAYGPLIAAVLTAIVRLLGWLPISFATQYGVVVAMVLEVPLLLVALSVRSRDRHGAQIREQALSSQDALTGLLAPHIFQDRLKQALARFRRDRDDAAVVFIDLVNYGRIKSAHGSAVAEQSLLRSVIKLRRVLRDVDMAARVGEARFGLILDGVSTRASVTDRAARLIAAGLMPLQGLRPEVTLQFHVAGVLLRERLLEPEPLQQELATLLAGMSPRTRRPIRFLQPEDTLPLEGDSELPEDAVTVAMPVR